MIPVTFQHRSGTWNGTLPSLPEPGDTVDCPSGSYRVVAVEGDRIAIEEAK